VDAVAIGGNASATASNSVALGSGSTTTANLSAAAYNPGTATLSGTASVANGEVSMGAAGKERRVTNVAAGAAATDAVNVSQLMSEDAKVNGVSNNLANLSNTVNNINTASTGNITNLTNIVNNITNGGGIKYFHANSTLADSAATGVNSVAIGGAATASASNSVALGANSLADRANTVSVGSSTAQRQIINLAAGTAATDAVNVAQLSGVTKAIGGGATVNADGTIQQPVYNLNGATYSNVGDALSGIINSTTNLQTAIKYINFGPSTATASQASGTDSIAIGGNSFANGSGALAIGAGARALAVNSVAIGYGSATSVANTFAVGASTSTRRIVNVADGVNNTDAATVGQVNADIASAIASLNTSGLHSSQSLLKSSQLTSSQLLGVTSSLTPDQLLASGPTDKQNMIEATGTDSMAIGLNTHATADSAIAAGQNVQIGSANSVGVGQNIAVNGTNTVAIGSVVSANAANAVVIGTNGTEADADNAIAIGNNVAVGGINTMAIGKDIVATGSNSITLGNASSDGGRANVLSIGSSTQQRQIINMAAGTSNTDGVNVSQLKGAIAALGGGATVNASTGAVSTPSYLIGGTTFTTVGDALTALNSEAGSGSPLGVVYDGASKNAITLAGSGGTMLTNLAAGSLSATSTDAVTGAQLFATNQNLANLTSVVNNISTTGAGTGAGTQTKYFHANSTLADSSAAGENAVSIGGAATAAASNSVALGSGSVADRADTVSVGSAGSERQITNVAAATADTDAVNFAQMNAAIAKVQNLGASGSDGLLAMDGDRNAQAARVAPGMHGLAIGASATSSGNQAIATGFSAQASGDSSIAMGANSKASADHAVALGDGSVADRANTVSVGSADNERQITNVAAGTQTTDAVNVGQLNAAVANAVGDLPAGTTAKEYTDQQISMVQKSVSSVARNAYSGVAAATALTMIPDVDQGKTIAVGIGTGSYQGYQATALGASARITQNIKVKLGAGISSQGTTFGAGASYQW
jgi:trimeric autotransporter adhesin